MRSQTEQENRHRILSAVVAIIEVDGHDAVALRQVAQRCRLSLATIYELFGSRDELIVSAVEQWMEANAYSQLTPTEPGESTYETLMRGIRAVFEPWRRTPTMLPAFTGLGSARAGVDSTGRARQRSNRPHVPRSFPTIRSTYVTSN